MRGFARLQEPIYAAMRIVAGAMFLPHGLHKVFGWFLDRAQPALFSQKWFGGVIEVVCGLLVALGLFTRWAAFFASGTMAVAFFQFHHKGAWAGWQWLPLKNGGELAALYCFVFLFIVAKGPGVASLDRLLRRDP